MALPWLTILLKWQQQAVLSALVITRGCQRLMVRWHLCYKICVAAAAAADVAATVATIVMMLLLRRPMQHNMLCSSGCCCTRV
jgi:hypothetical protein